MKQNNNSEEFLSIYPKNMIKIYSEYDSKKKIKYPITGIKHYLQLIDNYSLKQGYFEMDTLSIAYKLKCAVRTILRYNKLLLKKSIIEKDEQGI